MSIGKGTGRICISTFEPTAACAAAARSLLDLQGWEVEFFPADGKGGRAMEAALAERQFDGVLDLTTVELADGVLGGTFGAGSDRLTMASLFSVPQVVVPGALDMMRFGPPDAVPLRMRERPWHALSPDLTLVRTTPEENDRLGKEIAFRASAAKGPVSVLVPLHGFSNLDCDRGEFWWPEADEAFLRSLLHWKSPEVQVAELDMHINDVAFAAAAVDTLLTAISRSK
jgi:uncharacterized protein (UPF0261 family)